MSPPSIFRGVRVYWTLTAVGAALTLAVTVGIMIYLVGANNQLRDLVIAQEANAKELYAQILRSGETPEGENPATITPGPAGPAGAQGERGVEGERGPAGPQGEPGEPGEPGAVGPAGPQGEQGPAGVDGADGADGANGAQGEPGATGPQGPAGQDGITNILQTWTFQFNGDTFVCNLTNQADVYSYLCHPLPAGQPDGKEE